MEQLPEKAADEPEDTIHIDEKIVYSLRYYWLIHRAN
jgi:hypothetical protein